MPQTQALQEGFKRQRHVIWLVGAILVVLTLTIGWFGDYRSCRRQVDVRAALIADREINRSGIQFWEDRGEPKIADRLRQRVRADKHIHQLDCGRVLPGT